MACIKWVSVGDAVGSVLDGLGLAGDSELQSGRSDFFVDVYLKLASRFLEPERRRMLSENGVRKIIAVIGDIMIDRYVTGGVDRISPEAPVPVFLHSHDRAVSGGAANVAVNIVALGCEVRLVGAVGNDQDADDLKSILTEMGVSTALLVTDRSRPTISKTRIMSGRQQFFRIDRESPGRLSRGAEEAIIKAARAAIAEAESSCSRIMPRAFSAIMCSSK